MNTEISIDLIKKSQSPFYCRLHTTNDLMIEGWAFFFLTEGGDRLILIQPAIEFNPEIDFIWFPLKEISMIIPENPPSDSTEFKAVDS